MAVAQRTGERLRIAGRASQEPEVPLRLLRLRDEDLIALGLGQLDLPAVGDDAHHGERLLVPTEPQRRPQCGAVRPVPLCE